VSHHRKLDQGIKQPLITRFLPSRASRHGKPRTQRVRRVEEDANGKLVVIIEQAPCPGERAISASKGPTGQHGLRNLNPQELKTGGDPRPSWWVDR
jgi:hypothetical protein